MPKTGGEITKQRILEEAELLFSTNGFDATSIDSIAKAVQINKATIYYHFKDKNDIIASIFQNTLNELNARIGTENIEKGSLKEKIKSEITFLRSKRNILAILVMEQLKSGDGNHFFLIGKNVIDAELAGKEVDKNSTSDEVLKKFYLHEFFTGFIPVIMYVVFEVQWTEYFGYNKEQMLDIFIDLFEKTHFKTQII